MRSFKGILLTGTAIMALVACSSDKGPGKIGSLDDIVVRNHGEKVAMAPPGAEPVKEVKIDEAATTGDTAAPSASEMIAAEDTGAMRSDVEQTAAAAQEAQKEIIADAQTNVQAAAVAHPQALAEQAADDAAAATAQVQETATAVTAAATPDTAPGMNWNQPRRIASPEEADALVEEQMAQTAPPPAPSAAAPVPSAPPAADIAHAQAAQIETPVAPVVSAAAAEPKIPVTAPEHYTQDPNAPYSPAAARAAAAAQTGTVSDAPVAAAPAAAAESAPVPMALARVDGPMPLDPAVLQAKDPASIRSLQKTLADAGFYKGALNGEMNSDTLNAYVKYQSAAQVNTAPAPTPAPAPQPVAETQPAPAPAPAPVIDNAQAQAAPEALTQDAPDTFAPPPAPLSQRRAVSRQTPEPLPPVEPFHSTPSGSITPVPAPSVAPAPVAAPAATAATPTTTFGAAASLTDPAVISAAQRALSAKGLYTGPANGAVDADTLNALVRYQASNGLTPGMLNIETLKSLGVVAQ